jgi:hypothetical protein
VAANWTGGAVPGAADEAVFNPAISNTNVINSDTVAATVGKLTIKPGYTGTINLQSLTVGQAGGTSTIEGGTISVSGDGTVGLVEFTAGTLNWSAGTISSKFMPPGAGAFDPPDFRVDSGVTCTLTDSANFAGPFDLYVNKDNQGFGTMVISTSHDINVGNGSVIINSGIIEVQSDVGFVGARLRGQGEFDNFATFGKTAGTGTTGLDMPFKNLNAASVFTIQSGTVSLVASGTQTNGKTEIYAGTTLQTSTTYEVDAGVLQGHGAGTSTIMGNLLLAGGDFYVGTDGTIAKFVITNNYTQTGGTLHIDIDDNQTPGWDLLTVRNTASLGGTLEVNTLSDGPASCLIMTYFVHINDFASVTYLGGETYTESAGTSGYLLTAI